VICLEAAEGTHVWTREPTSFPITRGAPYWHGASCHPIVFEHLLIVEIGAKAGNLVALERATGKTVWASDDSKLGYSSPTIATLNDRPALVQLTGSALVGLNPADGKLLFREPMKISWQCPCASPLVVGNRIWISSNYWSPGSAVYDVGADGKLTQAWSNADFRAHTATPALVGGHLYGFDGSLEQKNGSLKCVEFATGRIVWTQKDVMGHLTAADGKLFILGVKGELIVAEASPKGYRELARAGVLQGNSWSQPVVANGRLYLRNDAGKILCIKP
jgi:outer membrane protein assembly factor BamB